MKTSIDPLADRITALGVRVRVEALDRQLIVTPVERMPDSPPPSWRQAVIELARSSGFSHVSLEIPGDGDEAALYRDQSV